MRKRLVEAELLGYDLRTTTAVKRCIGSLIVIKFKSVSIYLFVVCDCTSLIPIHQMRDFLLGFASGIPEQKVIEKRTRFDVKHIHAQLQNLDSALIL